MAESAWSAIRRDGTVTILGATRSYELTYEDGDVNIVESEQADVIIRHRGGITGLRRGDDEVGQITLTTDLRQFTDGTEDTIVDVLRGRNNWANESVGGAGFEGHFTDAQFDIDKVALGETAIQRATYYTIRWRLTGIADGDPMKLKWQGTVLEGYAHSGPA